MINVRRLARAAEATSQHMIDGVIADRHPFLTNGRFSWLKWAEYQAAEYDRLGRDAAAEAAQEQLNLERYGEP